MAANQSRNLVPESMSPPVHSPTLKTTHWAVIRVVAELVRPSHPTTVSVMLQVVTFVLPDTSISAEAEAPAVILGPALVVLLMDFGATPGHCTTQL